MPGDIFVKGLVLGFSIAAPVGPVGVLCIRRTLAEGRAAGLASGLGAATADAFYGAVAGLGLTAISGLLVGGQLALRLGGGLFLCWLGVRTFQAIPAETDLKAGRSGLLAAYATTFLITLTNPLTILSFAAIFAGLGVTAAGSYAEALWLILGVFLGSALWWLLLSGGVSLLRTRFDQRARRWVNRLSGMVILGFGLAALVSTLWP